MANLVLNEWIWVDASGSNGRSLQRKAVHVLVQLLNRKDRVVVVRDSAFDRKFWLICKSADPLIRETARLWKGIIWNSEVCCLIEPEELALLPDHLAMAVKDDDRYLVLSHLRFPESTIVTTDGPLIEILTFHGLRVRHRDEFLIDYLKP